MQVRILSVAFGIQVVASFRQPDVRFYGCNLTFFTHRKDRLIRLYITRFLRILDIQRFLYALFLTRKFYYALS